jgi:ATP-dependent helicase/nuclease subunit A
MNQLPIEIISASAGSGKTSRLAEELEKAIKGRARPEGILATTFTNKAASELMAKVRTRLLQTGNWESAQRVFDGYVGTVNSVCGRLLKEFAFEAGLSPTLDVLPEGDDQFIYARAIAAAVDQHSHKIDPVALRFEIEDWRDVLKKIIKSAKENDLGPKDLGKCAQYSWEGFRKLMPDPFPGDHETLLDDDLTKAIAETQDALSGNGDETGKTRFLLEDLQNLVRRQSHASSLSWPKWASLAKADPGAKSREACRGLIDAACKHESHPRLHEDIRTFIYNIFECAATGLQEFADFKKRHGLIDFVDQESLSLKLLQRQDVRAHLKENLDIVVVDEFQDTSPIQLALFVELADIAPKSIWVGDQKQSIYGFRGTDPALMDTVIDRLIDSDQFSVLPYCYRSRPSLVEFTSTLFEKAFEPLGIPPKRVRLKAKREDAVGQGVSLLFWKLSRKNVSEECRSLAAGVLSLLQKADQYLVTDTNNHQTRNLRGGDIAVLCRKNKKCAEVADALESLGIRATIPRPGLLATPECVLGLAALRYLADPDDTLAAAEILHFIESPTGCPKWFSDSLATFGVQREPNQYVQELDSMRDRLLHVTPSQALEMALNTVEIYENVLRWGDGTHRIANVEMLRALSSVYEDQCLVRRSAATPAGLVTFLSETVKNKELDVQPEGYDEHTVQVLTYHGAKGLEWPVVVMTDLHSKVNANPFSVRVVSGETDFDPRQPLMGRVLRYWPWPYGGHSTKVGLDQSVEKSLEYGKLVLSEKKEMVRLLYVGMTRARDYLVLAAGTGSDGKSNVAWLDLLRDEQGRSILSLPTATGEQSFRMGNRTFNVTIEEFRPLEPDLQEQGEQTYVAPTEHQDKVYLPARLIPSKLAFVGNFKTDVSEIVALGDRLPLNNHSDMDILGQAIHAFLTIDDHSETKNERLKAADRILKNWHAEGLAADSLLVAGDRLRLYLDQEYGKDCVWYREWPVSLKVGDQKAKGWIDLLVETPSGYVIVDHKSFPGSRDKWREKALEYAPQLNLYAQAVEKATERPIVAIVIHMPILGVFIRLHTSASR